MKLLAHYCLNNDTSKWTYSENVTHKFNGEDTGVKGIFGGNEFIKTVASDAVTIGNEATWHIEIYPLKSTFSAHIVDMRSGTNNIGLQPIYIYYGNNPYIQFHINTGNVSWTPNMPFSKSLIKQNEWNTIQVTWKNPDIYVYINNVQVQHVSWNASNRDTNLNISCPIYLGCRFSYNNNNTAFNGYIRDFRLYDKALSKEELSTLSLHIDPTLVCHYTFDEESPEIITDTSVFKNNPIDVQGMASYSSGVTYPVGPRCIVSTNGTPSYIMLPNDLKLPAPFTYSIWACTDWRNVRKLGRDIRIISCTDSGGFNIEAVQFAESSPENAAVGLTFAIFDSATNAYTSSINVIDSAYSGKSDFSKFIDLNENDQPSWHLFTFTLSESNLFSAYIDGKLADSSQLAGTISYNPTNYMFIGAEANGTDPPSCFFEGGFDDFRAYCRELSSKEILDLYQARMLLYKGGALKVPALTNYGNAGLDNTGLLHTNMYEPIYKEVDGKKYLKIFEHNIYGVLDTMESMHAYYFDTIEHAACSIEEAKFSLLYLLQDKKIIPDSNKYEFMIIYPESGLTNIWSQTINPFDVENDKETDYQKHTVEYMGYEEIRIQAKNQWGNGLRRSYSKQSLLDCDAGRSTWYGAIGQRHMWTSETSPWKQIPGPDGKSYKHVQLWIRVDNAKVNFDTLITATGIFASEFIED